MMAPRCVELDQNLPLRVQDKLLEVGRNQSGHISIGCAGPRLGFDERGELSLRCLMEEKLDVVRVVLLLIVEFVLLALLGDKDEMRGLIRFHAQLLCHLLEEPSAVLSS